MRRLLSTATLACLFAAPAAGQMPESTISVGEYRLLAPAEQLHYLAGLKDTFLHVGKGANERLRVIAACAKGLEPEAIAELLDDPTPANATHFSEDSPAVPWVEQALIDHCQLQLPPPD